MPTRIGADRRPRRRHRQRGTRGAALLGDRIVVRASLNIVRRRRPREELRHDPKRRADILDVSPRGPRLPCVDHTAEVVS